MGGTGDLRSPATRPNTAFSGSAELIIERLPEITPASSLSIGSRSRSARWSRRRPRWPRSRFPQSDNAGEQLVHRQPVAISPVEQTATSMAPVSVPPVRRRDAVHRDLAWNVSLSTARRCPDRRPWWRFTTRKSRRRAPRPGLERITIHCPPLPRSPALVAFYNENVSTCDRPDAAATWPRCARRCRPRAWLTAAADRERVNVRPARCRRNVAAVCQTVSPSGMAYRRRRPRMAVMGASALPAAPPPSGSRAPPAATAARAAPVAMAVMGASALPAAPPPSGSRAPPAATAARAAPVAPRIAYTRITVRRRCHGLEQMSSHSSRSWRLLRRPRIAYTRITVRRRCHGLEQMSSHSSRSWRLLRRRHQVGDDSVGLAQNEEQAHQECDVHDTSGAAPDDIRLAMTP